MEQNSLFVQIVGFMRFVLPCFDDSDDIRDVQWRINLEKIAYCCPMRVVEWSNRGFVIPGSVFDPQPASAFDKPRSATNDAAVALPKIFFDFLHFFLIKKLIPAYHRTRGQKALPA